MLEWVTSKVVISIAAIVILASVSGFLYVQRGVLEEEELEQIANDMAGAINDIALVNSESTMIITFDRDGRGLSLPEAVNDMRYNVIVHRDMIECSQGDRKANADLLTSIHLFPPFDLNASNLTELMEADLEHQRIDLVSTGGLVVMRAPIMREGTTHYETFVFKEG